MPLRNAPHRLPNGGRCTPNVLFRFSPKSTIKESATMTTTTTFVHATDRKLESIGAERYPFALAYVYPDSKNSLATSTRDIYLRMHYRYSIGIAPSTCYENRNVESLSRATKLRNRNPLTFMSCLLLNTEIPNTQLYNNGKLFGEQRVFSQKYNIIPR